MPDMRKRVPRTVLHKAFVIAAPGRRQGHVSVGRAVERLTFLVQKWDQPEPLKA
jgi:hypothetical protein